MKYLTTSKGRFVLSGLVLDKGGNIEIQNTEYKVIGKLSEITEKESRDIIDSTAYLIRVLNSQGIKMTDNTYIFKCERN